MNIKMGIQCKGLYEKSAEVKLRVSWEKELNYGIWWGNGKS